MILSHNAGVDTKADVFRHNFRTNKCFIENTRTLQDDVTKWKHFPRYWPFARGIQRSPVSSPHKGQWHGALMFSLICARKNGWVNNHEAGDLRGNRAHYDVIIMGCLLPCNGNKRRPWLYPGNGGNFQPHIYVCQWQVYYLLNGSQIAILQTGIRNTESISGKNCNVCDIRPTRSILSQAFLSYCCCFNKVFAILICTIWYVRHALQWYLCTIWVIGLKYPNSLFAITSLLMALIIVVVTRLNCEYSVFNFTAIVRGNWNEGISIDPHLCGISNHSFPGLFFLRI